MHYYMLFMKTTLKELKYYYNGKRKLMLKELLMYVLHKFYILIIHNIHTLLQFLDFLQSWESLEKSSSGFTADITPVILAAHTNNYEILKLLLDRGASLPATHDIRYGISDLST